jgi:hypothetical protein
MSAPTAAPTTQSKPARAAGLSLVPSAAIEASSTRLSVDQLILDYLLWYCTSALLIERCLRVEGHSNKSEHANAARNGDNAMKLVNSSCVHAFCFYYLHMVAVLLPIRCALVHAVPKFQQLISMATRRLLPEFHAIVSSRPIT